MFLISRLRRCGLGRSSALKKRCPTSRQPPRARPQVEALEERTLLVVEAISLAHPSLISGVGPGATSSPSVSADGRYVAFQSMASNLIAGVNESIPTSDVFLLDRMTGTLTLVSHIAGLPTTPPPGSADIAAPVISSTAPVISADGRFVAYLSTAPNLVAGQIDPPPPVTFPPTPPTTDLFLFDRETGTNILVSHAASSAVTAGNGHASAPVISADGRFVAYLSTATNLVTGQSDVPRTNDVFLFDRTTGQNVLVSHSRTSLTSSGNNDSVGLAMSADGRYVAYLSRATNVVNGSLDSNGGEDVFLFDRDNPAATVLVTHTSTSATTTGDGVATALSISADGRFIAYASRATNLVVGQTDTNGGEDVFLFDRDNPMNTRLVSHALSSTTTTGNGPSQTPAIAANGQYIAYTSLATNVASAADSNGLADVFLFNRTVDSTVLVSRTALAPLTAASGTNPSLSADGRYVAFLSPGNNLVTGQTDDATSADVFLFDRDNPASLVLVSHAAGSATAAGNPSDPPVISGNGSVVVYSTLGTNLVGGILDANHVRDVLVFDRASGVNSFAAVPAPGQISLTCNSSDDVDAMSLPIVVPSADGRYIAFVSAATNLVAGQTETVGPGQFNLDVFLHERATGTTLLVSRATTSPTTTGNAESRNPVISADGRYVAFVSTATNLANGDLGANDVFLFDRDTRQLTLVSRSLAGSAGTVHSINPRISADGRYIAYISDSQRLVPGQVDPSLTNDVFLYDRVTGTNTLVSRAFGTTATAANAGSTAVAISADGRYVAFASWATNLVAGQVDTNNTSDLFLFDRDNPGNTVLISRVAGTTTTAANNRSDFFPALSADGRYVAFLSAATNLVPGQIDTENTLDVFLFDRDNPANTALVSHAAGAETIAADRGSLYDVRISADGRYVAFVSFATDLVEGQVDRPGPPHTADVFLYDRDNPSSTILVSRAAGTTTMTGNADSGSPVVSAGTPQISADGRFVVFGSLATDLVAGFTGRGDGTQDVFLFDRVTGTVSLVNHTPGSATTASNQGAFSQNINADGSTVVFLGVGSNLVARDFNAAVDAFVFRPATPLQVASFTPTGDGFTLLFNQSIDPSDLNLYDAQGASLGPADVTVVGSATGPVRGSLTVNAGRTAIAFLRTGGVLPPDTYTVTLRSAANGFKDAAGNLLDGNRDGMAGGDFVTTFVVSPSAARVVSVADFTRGPGQPVNVSASGGGLPLRISDGTNVSAIDLTLFYDPTLLSISGVQPGPGLPPGATATLDRSVPGVAVVTFRSPTAPLGPGATEFALLTATVPDNAPYATKHFIEIGPLQVNGGAIPVLRDNGLHVVSYVGDTTGNGGYSSADALRALRVALGFDAGFGVYQLADPVLLADVTGNGRVNAADATRILQRALGMTPAEIPPLPGILPPIVPGGPDPLLRFPEVQGRPGDTVTLPLLLDPADGLESLDLAIAYDAQRLEVRSADDIRRGLLTADFDLFAAVLDLEAGTIRVGMGRSAGPVRGLARGGVLEITFRIKEDAPPGPAVVNLLRDLDSVTTQLNEGGLDLIPDPSNETGDVLDGQVTVAGPDVPGVERIVVSDATGRRSRVHRLTVTFSTVVTFQGNAADAFRLLGPRGRIRLRVETFLDEAGSRTVAQLTFRLPAGLGGPAAGNRLTLTIDGDRIADASGQPVDGDSDGLPGGDAVEAFFRLYGIGSRRWC
ncbi:MAG TPA: cohesin domain-containing protein [Gemmataceae bacterium]|nr:cohesin domain-containing protein [Gemmataceae bacterium]